MFPVNITTGITWVGVNDRSTELFEGLWDIKSEGISYNSYLIKDDKTALVDLSKEMMAGEYMDNLRPLLNFEELDYVIINHMEPDHSGALRTLLNLAPRVKLVGMAKTRDMLRDFYGITENVQVVADGDTLELGEHTLKFFSTPFVHWPETMMTYETSQKILFSCDGFGGYGALNGTIFDEPGNSPGWYEEQALRYFSNIISSFCRPVKNAITKVSSVPIQIIAPSHGLIWRNQPERIVQLYQNWANMASEPAEVGVTLLYASMYGNTETMMGAVSQGIAEAGIPLSIFNVSKTCVSYILPHLWTKRGVMVGAPTYEGGLFPAMKAVLDMAAIKHIFNRQTACFGSHAWSGGGVREFEKYAETLKWPVVGTLDFTGSPNPEELQQGREFGLNFARQILA